MPYILPADISLVDDSLYWYDCNRTSSFFHVLDDTGDAYYSHSPDDEYPTGRLQYVVMGPVCPPLAGPTPANSAPVID